ncbi:Carbohydrate esterase family 9 protein [Mycena kentingensis (nom. inval.)]|nr:Carbohydrate esterase family 9 protein [Mycena kentingensis (nom. inval.)]
MPLSPTFPLVVFLVAILCWTWTITDYFPDRHVSPKAPILQTNANARHEEARRKCDALYSRPGPSSLFAKREVSDRFENDANSSWLITNATLVVGRGNDTHWVQGDVYLDRGIIKAVGRNVRVAQTVNLTVINANRRWVTAGLVDINTLFGVQSAPFLAGAFDAMSNKEPTTPWLQTVDGLDTYDEAFNLAMAGGVTSALIQSGGKNTLGSQAFVFKPRKTRERSPSSMLVEPQFYSEVGDAAAHWRHLVQKCGDPPASYGTRPDAIWSLREAVKAGLWTEALGAFPDDFRLEILVDVLRGKVKVSAECQKIVDIDALVRLTNEFKFHVSSLQHASEAWLAPGLLNRTFGGAPTVSLFATNHRYDYPSYRGSQFAPRVLSDAGLPVALKSGHPTINSRYLVQEAQLAHYYGLPPHLALAAITSVPAAAIGMDHRLGSLTEGADADVVLWDINPLQIGAAPMRVWVDGQLQIPLAAKNGNPVENVPVKAAEGRWARIPTVPDWDKERQEAMDWEGTPPMKARVTGKVVFRDVRELRVRGLGYRDAHGRTVVMDGGRIVCAGNDCIRGEQERNAIEIDLRGGVIVPGMLTFGSRLGVEEISSEPSSGTGIGLNALVGRVPQIMHDAGATTFAVDALMFGTRHALLAYHAGVTSGLATTGDGLATVSCTFSTGALHAMERGAIKQSSNALHISVQRSDGHITGKLAVHNKIATIRRLLMGWENSETDTGSWFKKAAEGIVPIVIDVDGADIMASLLILKDQIENAKGSRMRMVFSGAAEAHLLAQEIGNAHVGVILDVKPNIGVWDVRRALHGPPITNDTTLVSLRQAGVKVGLRWTEAQATMNTRFDAMFAANGEIGEEEAYSLVSTNLHELLGVTAEEEDFVAYAGGGVFDLASKAVAVGAAPLLIPLPRDAASEMTRQLSSQPENLVQWVAKVRDYNPTYLKKATREMERSSRGVREDAKMALRAAGVTLRDESEGGGAGRAVLLPELVVDMNNGVTAVVFCVLDGMLSVLNRKSFHEDMITVQSRLPTKDEFRRVRNLILDEQTPKITDDHIAQCALKFAECPHLEQVVLNGVPSVTDRSIVLLTDNAINLQGLDLSGCNLITDLSVFELTAKSLPLQCIQLNGVVGLTDASVSALCKSCSRLSVLELCDLPLLSALSVRDIFTHSRKLRTLSLARCPLLTDKAFPSTSASRAATPVTLQFDKPLPPRPSSLLDELPPLILRHTADNLRIVDLSFLAQLTDNAIDGLVGQLSDRTLESICKLGDHLDVLLLAHCSEITDNGIVKLARACTKLRCIDVGFCRNLTDMSVFCLAELRYIRRLSLVRIHRMTDIAIFAIAEHALDLERLNLSYCDKLSLDAVHLLLKRLVRLQNFSATGIPAFRRTGVQRFVDPAPLDYDAEQAASYHVFTGDNVGALRRFLTKEETRRRECEAKNIPFTERSDDGTQLY